MKNYRVKNSSFNILSACSIGTALEWYDFSLYGFLAPIISINFFSEQSHSVSLLLTYYIFAIGFLARPVGAIIFGHFGDRINRKSMLLISILLMASTTCLIGVLPTYKDIGNSATFLLMFLRASQGIAIGGETIGAGTFVIESTPKSKQGFYTAIIWASSGVGILFSSIVISICNYIFTNQELSQWAWRIPFILGSLTGLIGYYFRKNMLASEECMQIKKSKLIKFPLIEAIKHHRAKLVMAIGMYMLCAITTYILFVYMPTFINTRIGIPLKKTMLVNSISMACMILLVPLVGHYSDSVGRKRILLISSICFILFSVPLYLLLTHGALLSLIIAQTLFAILTAGFQGPLTGTILSMFPPSIRYSAAALGYNLSYSLFGGTAPIIAIFLTSKLHNNIAPSFYIILAAIIALVAILKINANDNSIA
jgi:MHS family proline/betaine transporter-like MFS transporter